MSQVPASSFPKGLDNTGDPRTTFHEILSDSRRCLIIKELSDRSSELTLRDLAAYVAAHENAGTIADVADKEVEATYISLYHTHIPRLKDAGVIRFDSDREMVKLVGEPDWWSEALQFPDNISV